MAIHPQRSSIVQNELPASPDRTSRPNACLRGDACDPFFGRRREAIIQSIIGSQALEGVHLTYEEVARIVDEVRDEPIADIG